MPAINFQKRFVEDIKSGKIRQAIRPQRKRGAIWKGCDLALYTVQRTKYCTLLRRAKCTNVSPIIIDEHDVYIGALRLMNKAIERLAKNNGFKDVDEFFDFFRKQYGFPFDDAELIQWE